MINLDMARWVGTAPGTSTVTYPRNPALGQVPAVFPTQAVLEPDPNSDSIKIALPPNQWATGPVEMVVNVPAGEKNLGPVPTDLQIHKQGRPYLPVQRGWIANADGPNIYHLQGPLGLGADPSASSIENTAVKWSIAASVISALALATTTVIAVARYKKGR